MDMVALRESAEKEEDSSEGEDPMEMKMWSIHEKVLCGCE